MIIFQLIQRPPQIPPSLAADVPLTRSILAPLGIERTDEPWLIRGLARFMVAHFTPEQLIRLEQVFLSHNLDRLLDSAISNMSYSDGRLQLPVGHFNSNSRSLAHLGWQAMNYFEEARQLGGRLNINASAEEQFNLAYGISVLGRERVEFLYHNYGIIHYFRLGGPHSIQELYRNVTNTEDSRPIVFVPMGRSDGTGTLYSICGGIALNNHSQSPRVEGFNALCATLSALPANHIFLTPDGLQQVSSDSSFRGYRIITTEFSTFDQLIDQTNRVRSRHGEIRLFLPASHANSDGLVFGPGLGGVARYLGDYFTDPGVFLRNQISEFAARTRGCFAANFTTIIYGCEVAQESSTQRSRQVSFARQFSEGMGCRTFGTTNSIGISDIFIDPRGDVQDVAYWEEGSRRLYRFGEQSLGQEHQILGFSITPTGFEKYAPLFSLINTCLGEVPPEYVQRVRAQLHSFILNQTRQNINYLPMALYQITNQTLHDLLEDHSLPYLASSSIERARARLADRREEIEIYEEIIRSCGYSLDLNNVRPDLMGNIIIILMRMTPDIRQEVFSAFARQQSDQTGYVDLLTSIQSTLTIHNLTESDGRILELVRNLLRTYERLPGNSW